MNRVMSTDDTCPECGIEVQAHDDGTTVVLRCPDCGHERIDG